MMKFAMLDDRTRIALQQHGTTKWIIAGYFFHDRGKLIQKSIQGMLQALLYTILCQSRGLRDIVQPLYMKMVAKEQTKLVVWDFEPLKTAFQMIVQQRTVKTRLCLFLDALDEHHGDNDRLSDMLHELAATVDNDVVQLRLCLASRPWDTFVNNFGDCPGFKIHEHTLGDIESYTSSRLRDALSKLKDPDEIMERKLLRLHHLVDKVSKKAQGVFIWVRIVVELISAAIQSRTPFVALDAMSDEMPEELTELYLHTLKRIESNHAEESYVMLQLARCALIPLNLEAFVNATSWNLWRKVPEPTEETLADMVQRVTSRSGGLLEVIEVFTSDGPSDLDLENGADDVTDATNNGPTSGAAHGLDDIRELVDPPRTKSHIIQFCHQTVKEFIQNAPVNFGLQRTNEEGNGYEYLLNAAHPGCKTWGKHMADEALEYAVLAHKDTPSMALEDIRRILTALFTTMGLNSMLHRKNLQFYVDQELGGVEDVVRCLMFSSGLLEVVTEFPQDDADSFSSSEDNSINNRNLWLTALIGPRATSYKPSRKDMLEALWSNQQTNLVIVSVGVYAVSQGISHPLQPLEIMVLDRLLQLGGTDGMPAFEFLFQHGASPNMSWTQGASRFVEVSSIASQSFDMSETIFITAVRLDSAPLVRLFGKYGARVPQKYLEPLRRISAVVRNSSQVFTEVMRIMDRQEEALPRTNISLGDEMEVGKKHFPAARLRNDEVQLGLLFPGIIGGMTIANGKMLFSRHSGPSAIYMFVRVVMLIIRWKRSIRTRR